MTVEASRPVAVIGAGGHAKVVISTLQAAGQTVAAVFDDDPVKWGSHLLGVPVRGPVAGLREAGFRAAVIAVGDNADRQRIAGGLSGLEWVSAIHPTAYVHPSARIGPGTVVFAGAAIQPDSAVGAHVIINTGAKVDHDCFLGDYVHLAPGVHLAGGARISPGSFLGVGVSVIQGVQIGEWTTVGAGAAVIGSLPARVTAVGVPARPVKP